MLLVFVFCLYLVLHACDTICKCDIIFVPYFFLLPDRRISAVVTEVPVKSPHRPPSLRRLTAFKLQVCRDGSISGTIISAIISGTISSLN